MNAEREAKLVRMHEQLDFMRSEIEYAKTSAIKKSEAVNAYVPSIRATTATSTTTISHPPTANRILRHIL
jgi:hypothetical protein